LENLAKVIENNKMVLSLLDSLEEYRDLSLHEWNFRKLVQDNLLKLPEQHKEYWKQIGRIKWATLGDENTTKFHSTVTIQDSRNAIMMLKNRDDSELFSHEDKLSPSRRHTRKGLVIVSSPTYTLI
jgi:hypothetical protein